MSDSVVTSVSSLGRGIPASFKRSLSVSRLISKLGICSGKISVRSPDFKFLNEIIVQHCWQRMWPAISVNKGWWSLKAFSYSIWTPTALCREFRKKNKNRILAPDSYGAYPRSNSKNPVSCIFPHIEKGWIILRCLSGLISTNLLMFDSLMLVCCFCKNSYKSWLLLYIFGTVPQSYLRGCIPSLSPQ